MWLFFFFKQTTAYELRISDWSSDVCSSDLSVVPHMVFPQDVMDKASQKALELGCSPDYNAWTGGVNPPPDASQNPLMRCAGGHLHVGWTEGESLGSIQHVMNCSDLVKQLAWYLGLWSLGKDKDKEIGRANVCTPVTNAHLVCRLLLAKKKHDRR